MTLVEEKLFVCNRLNVEKGKGKERNFILEIVYLCYEGSIFSMNLCNASNFLHLFVTVVHLPRLSLKYIMINNNDDFSLNTEIVHAEACTQFYGTRSKIRGLVVSSTFLTARHSTEEPGYRKPRLFPERKKGGMEKITLPPVVP